jgi:esterase/lipase
LAALEKFMGEVEERLPEITTPALIIQSKGDPVVDSQGTNLLFEQLGSQQKDYRLFDFERHGILMGDGADKVHAEIGKFIEMIRDRQSR